MFYAFFKYNICFINSCLSNKEILFLLSWSLIVKLSWSYYVWLYPQKIVVTGLLKSLVDTLSKKTQISTIMKSSKQRKLVRKVFSQLSLESALSIYVLHTWKHCIFAVGHTKWRKKNTVSYKGGLINWHYKLINKFLGLFSSLILRNWKHILFSTGKSFYLFNLPIILRNLK